MKDGMTDWDRLAEQRQLAVIQQEEALYSARVLQEAREPKNLGRIAEAEAQAIVKGPCGDTMEFYLRLEGGRIQQVSFVTDGCGSCLSRMVQGMRLEQAAAIQSEELLEALDGLPESHAHCATLAVTTLREALRGQGANSAASIEGGGP